MRRRMNLRMMTPEAGENLVERCATAIRDARHILAVCHVDPDGDAIGSLLGMGWLLRALGRSFVLACDGPEPDNLAFLPRPAPIVTTCPAGCDLVVTLDCNSHDRLGTFCSRAQLAKLPIVNIDHHVTNTQFGAINWVDMGAAATAEMVHHLVVSMHVPLSLEMAICVLAGIVSDTWGFRTPNTTVRTMEVALQAMHAGAPLADIVANTVDGRSFSSVCLWGRVISEARLEDGVLWAEVTQEHLRACRATRDGKAGLANFLMSVRECQVAVVLVEAEDRLVDVSLRSRPGVDVSEVALSLGGGGHPQAAGCTLKESLSVARARVDAALSLSLGDLGVSSTGEPKT